MCSTLSGKRKGPGRKLRVVLRDEYPRPPQMSYHTERCSRSRFTCRRCREEWAYVGIFCCTMILIGIPVAEYVCGLVGA